MATEMTPYDQKAWNEILAWRERRLTGRSRRLVTPKVRDRARQAGHGARDRLEKLPGAGEFESLFARSLGGLIDLGSRAAMTSVRDGAVVKGFQRRGHETKTLDDIRELDLRDIDRVKPNLALGYTTASTIEGAAAGFAITGGEAVATSGSVFGAGAGGAPGIGMVVGVMAADAAAVLVAATRAVAHTAAYYGYDVGRPDERLFALAVLSMGTASEAGKTAAYVELNKLVQMLARRATWEQLRQSTVTRVLEKVFARLGYRITQRKLGQAVPVVGGLLGAGMNARLLLSVVDDADRVYRERFLRERYGLDVGAVDETIREVPQVEPEVIDIAHYLEDEAELDELGGAGRETP